jgi:hypothetical protein
MRHGPDYVTLPRRPSSATPAMRHATDYVTLAQSPAFSEAFSHPLDSLAQPPALNQARNATCGGLCHISAIACRQGSLQSSVGFTLPQPSLYGKGGIETRSSRGRRPARRRGQRPGGEVAMRHAADYVTLAQSPAVREAFNHPLDSHCRSRLYTEKAESKHGVHEAGGLPGGGASVPGARLQCDTRWIMSH